jgi:hypothetical protein
LFTRAPVPADPAGPWRMTSRPHRWAPLFVAVVAVAAVVVLGACTPPESSNTVSTKGLTKASRDLFSFIPDADYNVLCYIDLDKFSGSEFGRRIIEFNPAYNVWTEKLGVGMDRISRVAIAAKLGKDTNKPGEAIVLMWGDPDQEWIFNELGRKREYFKREELEGSSIFTLEDFSFTLLSQKLLAIGTPEIIRESLRLARGKGSALTAGKELNKFTGYLEQEDALWLAIDGIDRIIKPVAEKEEILKGFTTLRSGILAISFKKDASFRVQVTCSSEDDASQIASSLVTLVGMLNLVIKNADFTDLPQELEPKELRSNLISMLQSIQVESSGTLVTFTFTAPQQIIEYLARITKKIVSVNDAS